MKNPYLAADKAIKLLNKKAVKRFLAAEQTMAMAGFDELNVLSVCKNLYRSLQNDNLSAYETVAKQAYQDAGKEAMDYLIFRMWIEEEILGKPSPVTKYIYHSEVTRKRDRLAEGILAASQKTMEFRKGLRYWADMTAQYADIVTDEAMLKSYRDQGIQYVRWRTERDERVCPVCSPRDGKVYPIDKAPSKAHWRCRCWYEPV